MSGAVRKALPSPAPRRHYQCRRIEFNGYFRDDGLWDIDGRLIDTKPTAIRDHRMKLVPAGSTMHEMHARLTIDDDMVVREAHAAVVVGPYESCYEVGKEIAALVGHRIGPGWREAVRRSLPAKAFCTHLGELVLAMATAAYQTQANGKTPEDSSLILETAAAHKRPHYIDKCYGWRADGPIVREVFPYLAVKREKPKE